MRHICTYEKPLCLDVVYITFVCLDVQDLAAAFEKALQDQPLKDKGLELSLKTTMQVQPSPTPERDAENPYSPKEGYVLVHLGGGSVG